ncbi:MAG TPA: arsenical-resistance protein, partial [Noviherbaspirillum sp.]|nr:arsenical-resistance protein [Noviherbaspirillum sp.]
MSTQTRTLGTAIAGASLGFFERYLTIWVAACILAGILLGQAAPGVFQALAALEIAH